MSYAKTKKFEPVYHSKKVAEERKSWYNAREVRKVKGSFTFVVNGKRVKRKTGYKLIGGKI